MRARYPLPNETLSKCEELSTLNTLIQSMLSLGVFLKLAYNDDLVAAVILLSLVLFWEKIIIAFLALESSRDNSTEHREYLAQHQYLIANPTVFTKLGNPITEPLWKFFSQLERELRHEAARETARPKDLKNKIIDSAQSGLDFARDMLERAKSR